ncbi:MAG: hypothetical protein AUJ75_02625 [Candidatus Omnitrophica bacterium CG1_02_49_10]|nr:MAG: hypothetical protein AUJ75_02625 [Candidatus Omnitrophica bacterium CG1_02_49_10]
MNFFLHNKLTGFTLVIVIFAFSMALFTVISTEFMPRIDQGQFIVKITMPPGTKLETTDGVVKKVEEALNAVNDVKDITVTIGSTKAKSAGEALETLGSHQSRIMVNIKSKSERTHSTQEVIQKVKAIVDSQGLEGAEIEYLAQESVLQSAFQGGAPVQIAIKGPELEGLASISELVKTSIKKVDGVYSVRDSIVPPSPETKVHVLKDKSALYNLSVSDIALASQTALKGVVATKFKEEGKEIDVRVRFREEDRNNLKKIRGLILRSPMEVDVPLSEVAYLAKGKGPTEINREDQQRVVFVSANIFKRTLGDVAKDISEILSKIKISSKYVVEVGGENVQMKESFASLRFALILSLILVYMIMASQFESLWQPFIIMFTIPLSLIGVSWALSLTGTNLSVMVILGVIILAGIVVNNGIVLIDYVNNLVRNKGMSTFDALVDASRTRLRPILMTASTTILGLLPLAIGIMEGTELQVPMAITVMGGLMVSTFLSLIVIPMLYLVFDKVISRFAKPAPVVITDPAPTVKKEAEELPKKELPRAETEEDYVTVLKRSHPELSDRQIDLLDYIRKNVRVSRKDYADKFGISVPTAARDLKELQGKGLISGKGPFGPGRYYELT